MPMVTMVSDLTGCLLVQRAARTPAQARSNNAALCRLNRTAQAIQDEQLRRSLLTHPAYRYSVVTHRSLLISFICIVITVSMTY